ncbi:hypothetical protein EV649_4426 [Kribbella sp. VKM Ac-2569]|uniref:hypothetical protein n=1 Tax=Kribbella sp. VKM Ac-2569 TaxID=2512220 RepID=UPI00102BBCF3|nr:hypothetical protein [Kribbella sp. VKM Ac-2569]RZT16892.1 hypothetical protein EV649_4426 [Kribbella sp. VKM Ac-2569]
MIVLGLILVALAVGLGFGVAASSADDATLEVFGTGLGGTVAGVFFAGAATAAALVLGLWLFKNGRALLATGAIGLIRRRGAQR